MKSEKEPMILEKDLKKLLGDPFPYNVNKTEKFRRFNYGAAYFNAIWLGYRRMGRLALQYIFITFFLSLIIVAGLSKISFPYSLISIIFYAIIFVIGQFVFFGTFGDRVYFKFLKEMHEKRNFDLKSSIKSAVGISLLSLVLTIVFFIFIVFMIGIDNLKSLREMLS